MENKGSKKGGGQKILTVIVGVVVIVFATIMVIAAANTHGGESEEETTAKTYKKADVAGCWQVDPDLMKKGYSQYLMLTEDGKAKQYQMKGDAFDWYNDGKYTLKDNKIKANYTQFSFKSDIKDTKTYSYKPTYIVKDVNKNTLKLSIKGDDGRITVKLNRIDENKMKSIEDAATQKLNDFTTATMPKEHTFGAGQYICGQDFEPGVYDLISLSGSGNVMCDEEEINEVMGTDPEFDTATYKNADFQDGDMLEIKGNLQLKLEP